MNGLAIQELTYKEINQIFSAITLLNFDEEFSNKLDLNKKNPLQ